MAQPSSTLTSRVIAVVRGIYKPLGFKKGYNAVLFTIFAGAMLGFTLARFEYLSFNGIFCNSSSPHAAPGECYWYSMPRYHVGILLHLAGVLPAGFLAVFQFVPAIRHRAIMYHKTAGYLILLLVAIGIAGALMIARVSFGQDLAIQSMLGLLAIISTTSLSLAYYNIKRKQIEQHRAWMLRAWFYMGSIITLRMIMILCALVVSTYPEGFYTVQPCPKLLFAAANATAVYTKYPACNPNHANMTVDAQVVVKANLFSSVETAMSVLDISFGLAGWLSLFLHAVGVEIYLKLTPKEAERLRLVSYQRQLERGMKNPGSAGLVPEKFGDMEPWLPPDGQMAIRGREAGSESDGMVGAK